MASPRTRICSTYVLFTCTRGFVSSLFIRRFGRITSRMMFSRDLIRIDGNKSRVLHGRIRRRKKAYAATWREVERQNTRTRGQTSCWINKNLFVRDNREVLVWPLNCLFFFAIVLERVFYTHMCTGRLQCTWGAIVRGLETFFFFFSSTDVFRLYTTVLLRQR